MTEKTVEINCINGVQTSLLKETGIYSVTITIVKTNKILIGVPVTH